MREKDQLQIISKLRAIMQAFNQGFIAVETMPEDARPNLVSDSKKLVHYLTFPMALNYQRNSYNLWEDALKTFNDPSKNSCISPIYQLTFLLIGFNPILLTLKLPFSRTNT